MIAVWYSVLLADSMVNRQRGIKDEGLEAYPVTDGSGSANGPHSIERAHTHEKSSSMLYFFASSFTWSIAAVNFLYPACGGINKPMKGRSVIQDGLPR